MHESVRLIGGTVLAITLGATCFSYRYLAYDGFTNDHFVNLSRAQQILLGDVPLRDFVDPGLPLMYYLSAWFQLAFGGTLLSEAVLVFGGFALAAAITCWVAVRLTGSYAIAAAVTLCQILVLPRSYGYPKILLYALALLGIAFYARAPRWPGALALGGLTAAAFLMRHDHGVFLAIGCASAIVLAELPRGFRSLGGSLGIYAAAALAALLPYLLLVESTVGLLQYIRDGVEFSRAEAARSSLDVLPSVAAPLLAAANAEAWQFYLPWGVSLAAAARLLAARNHAAQVVLVPAIVMSLLVTATFLRSPLPARLPDVWGPLPIILAYALAPVPTGSAWLRAASRAAVALVLAITAWSVGVVGRVPDTVRAIGLLEGRERISDRWTDVTRGLSTSAAAALALELRRPTDERSVLAYLFACTTPSDRILVFMFAPEIYYRTARGFAAGHVAFVVGYHGSLEDQRLAIERWNRQSVPLALAIEDDARELDRYFPLIAGELQRRYVTVLTIADYREDGKPLVVMAERGRAGLSTYGPPALPCFANQVS